MAFVEVFNPASLYQRNRVTVSLTNQKLSYFVIRGNFALFMPCSSLLKEVMQFFYFFERIKKIVLKDTQKEIKYTFPNILRQFVSRNEFRPNVFFRIKDYNRPLRLANKANRIS